MGFARKAERIERDKGAAFVVSVGRINKNAVEVLNQSNIEMSASFEKNGERTMVVLRRIVGSV